MNIRRTAALILSLSTAIFLTRAVLVAAAQWRQPASETRQDPNTVFLPLVVNHPKSLGWAFQGASLTAYWHNSYALPDAFDQIDYLDGLGVNALTVLVNWYQDSLTAISMSPSLTLTVPDADLEGIIGYAHQKGMSVALKPHLEAKSGGWRGYFAPDDHAAWFQNYTNFITHYAELAERNDVELFFIGTEYRSLTQTSADLAHWTALADQLRTVYSGSLAYAAHESGVLGRDAGYHIIPATFWDHFDYAGTTVYYTLSSEVTPSVTTLVAAWQETNDVHGNLAHYTAELTAWQATHGKPVIFAEIGYRSVDCAANRPYQVDGSQCAPLAAQTATENFNPTAQANAYEAFFQAAQEMPWLAGVYWWQFEARFTSDRECANGLTADTNFTPCGKTASDSLRNWYGGNYNTPPPAYTPALPDIDRFEYQVGQPPFYERVWLAQSSGAVTYTLTTSAYLPNSGSQQSLFISTAIPLTDTSRYQQLNYTFGQPQDFSEYASLEIWANTDQLETAPYGCEFSVVLTDRDGERWQSSRWLDRKNSDLTNAGWAKIQIALTTTGAITGNPWHHPADFILPEWEAANLQNGQLDLEQITSLGIKSFTTDTDPKFKVWLDEIQLSETKITPPPLIALPVIDRFEYQEDATASLIWKWAASGQISITSDAAIQAPNSSRALHIHSAIPPDAERFAQVGNVFINGVQDFRAYDQIQFWARTANQPPYGGELSLELVETDPASGAQEIWRNTRWFGSPAGSWVSVELRAGSNLPADPWDAAYADVFVVPNLESFQDGILDLSRITAIHIIPLTTNEASQNGYDELEIWIDEMHLE